MRSFVISHLKPILNTSDEMQIDMRDGTVGHFPGHAAEVDLGHAHVDADAVLLRLRRLRHHREEYDGGAVVGRDHLGQGPSSLGVDRNHFSVEGSLVEFGGF